MSVFQLTEEDLNKYQLKLSRPHPKNVIGTWCYMVKGKVCGFYDTEQQAKEAYHTGYIFGDKK